MNYPTDDCCCRHTDWEFGDSDCQRVTIETENLAIVTNPIWTGKEWGNRMETRVREKRDPKTWGHGYLGSVSLSFTKKKMKPPILCIICRWYTHGITKMVW